MRLFHIKTTYLISNKSESNSHPKTFKVQWLLHCNQNQHPHCWSINQKCQIPSWCTCWQHRKFTHLYHVVTWSGHQLCNIESFYYKQPWLPIGLPCSPRYLLKLRGTVRRSNVADMYVVDGRRCTEKHTLPKQQLLLRFCLLSICLWYPELWIRTNIWTFEPKKVWFQKIWNFRK